jgi:tRNA threonylcarbamoyladenosine biosynthesis protein TsaB
MTSRILCRVDRLLAEASGTKPVLGLDTGTSTAFLGLVANGRIAGQLACPVTSHGAALPRAVDELLSASKLSLGDLGAIAVGIGPGSFTGLRIGLSYAKGIAMASGCAVVGVPSLDAIALTALGEANLSESTLICCVVDARKGEVYAALYGVVSDGLEKVSEELLVVLEDLASRVAGDVVFAGDMRAKDAAALFSPKGHVVAVLDTSKSVERGPCVAAIGAAMMSRGEIAEPATLEPMYIRPPEATVKPAAKPRPSFATEGVWSEETKN